MDRIHSNAVPMGYPPEIQPKLEAPAHFPDFRERRRPKVAPPAPNLVVHSLHLHPVGTEDEGVFKSQFNHLDAAHREKLRPREPSEEVALLKGQLEKASMHFSDFLGIVELTPSRKRESYL